jgi:hypothetical protein
VELSRQNVISLGAGQSDISFQEGATEEMIDHIVVDRVENGSAQAEDAMQLSAQLGVSMQDRALFLSDPELVFRNYAGGDIELRFSAPALGFTNPATAVPEDFLRRPRQPGSAIDPGAYEFLETVAGAERWRGYR